MRPVSLDLSGIRVFTAPQTFTFPDDGLHFITGVNEVEPALGANGAGKTSIGDGLTWVLYGKGIQGQLGTEVASWDTEFQTEGTFTFLDGAGETCTVYRSHSPNKIEYNGEPISQPELDDELGLDYVRFMQLCMLGQFSEWFLDLKPAARMQMVSDVLGLGVWEDAAKAATKTLSNMQADVGNLRATLTYRQTELDNQVELLATTKQRVKTWNIENAEQLAQVEARRAEISKAFKASVRLLKSATKEKAATSVAIENIERELAPIDADNRDLEAAASVVQSHFITAKADASAALRAHLKIENMPTHCVTCKQALEREGHEDMLKTSARAVRVADSLVEVRDQEREDTSLLVVEGIAKTTDMVRRLDELDTRNKKAAEDVRTANREAKIHQDRLTDLDTQHANPHADQIDPLKLHLAAMKVDIEDKAAHLKDEEEVLRAFEYWPKGMKDVRLSVATNALAELTLEINNAITELGLTGWKVVPERTTKAGGVSRGLFVLVTKPGGKPDVPWESWSGGERQRLRIAGAAGFKKLIASRNKTQTPFEFWDEPTSHLGTEGVKDLVEYFRDRSRDRMIFLIDHRSMDSGKFDSVYNVRRKAAGAIIEHSTDQVASRVRRQRITE